MPYLAVAEDQEWIVEMASGNERGFQKLFEKYHQQLGNYIFRLTGSLELAEEIVQDVFLKIWLNRETLGGISNFGGYLFIASKNHALNCLRKQVKARLNQERWETDYARTAAADTDPNPCYSLIDEAIDQLPPQQRKVYLLSRHERLKYAEIAERMNISHETVKKYLQIATASITYYVQENMEASLLLLFLINFL